jgi:MFS family permease
VIVARAERSRLVTPAFLSVAVATTSLFVALGMLVPAVPLYVEGPLRGTSSAVGIVVGAFAVSALLLRPWAGRLGDRRGRRLLMVAGGAVFAASILGYIVSRSVGVMVVMRLITGAAEALFFVGAAAAIGDLAPEDRRGEALSLFSVGLYAGIGIGPLIGEAVLREAGFTAAWAIAGALAAVAAALGSLVPETRPQPEPDTEDGRRPPLIHPAGIRPGVVLLANLLGMAGFFAFVPLYALQIGLSGSRIVFLTFSVVVLLIRGFGAKIPDRIGVGRAARASLALSAIGLVVVASWPSAVGLFAGAGILAVGQALAFPALMTLAIRGVPASERGSVVGTFTAFVDLSFGIGPVVLGFVAEAQGYRVAFAAAAVVSAAGLAGLTAARRRGRGLAA